MSRKAVFRKGQKENEQASLQKSRRFLPGVEIMLRHTFTNNSPTNRYGEETAPTQSASPVE
jgi:hypothetical protein